MTVPLLESMLVKLREGDVTCAERLFGEYGPYLRVIIRKQISPRLRSKFDSTDILQSVWTSVLRDLNTRGLAFDNTEHLRTFLVKVAQHRFYDQIRRHRGALENEVSQPFQELTVPSMLPRPSEEAQAGDAWERLLDLCPPAHQEVLQLKRKGLSLGEISQVTGLHVDSIRRILRNLARSYARDGEGNGWEGGAGDVDNL